MSSIKVEVDGNVNELIAKLNKMTNIDKRGVMTAIAEGLRTSTVERFDAQETPNGKKWTPSIRVREQGGKTLTHTAKLKTSIKSQVNSEGLAVGTNDIRAASLQFGDDRTIRAKNGKYLKFKIAGQWRNVEQVKIHIPKRPFIGVSKDDEEDIKDILNQVVEV